MHMDKTARRTLCFHQTLLANARPADADHASIYHGICTTTAPRPSIQHAPAPLMRRSLARKSSTQISGTTAPQQNTLTGRLEPPAPASSLSSGSRVAHTPHPPRPSTMKSAMNRQNRERVAGGSAEAEKSQWPRSKGRRRRVVATGWKRREGGKVRMSVSRAGVRSVEASQLGDGEEGMSVGGGEGGVRQNGAERGFGWRLEVVR